MYFLQQAVLRKNCFGFSSLSSFAFFSTLLTFSIRREEEWMGEEGKQQTYTFNPHPVKPKRKKCCNKQTVKTSDHDCIQFLGREWCRRWIHLQFSACQRLEASGTRESSVESISRNNRKVKQIKAEKVFPFVSSRQQQIKIVFPPPRPAKWQVAQRREIKNGWKFPFQQDCGVWLLGFAG